MCAYPVGETWHSPKSSPSAASKPAETVEKSVYCECASNEAFPGHTDHQLRRKLQRNWHHNLLEGMDIISICHPFRGPRNVNRTSARQKRSRVWLHGHTSQDLDLLRRTPNCQKDHKDKTDRARSDVWRCIIRLDRR